MECLLVIRVTDKDSLSSFGLKLFATWTVVIEEAAAAEVVKIRYVQFATVTFLMRGGMVEISGGVAVLGVNNVVDCFSPPGEWELSINKNGTYTVKD